MALPRLVHVPERLPNETQADYRMRQKLSRRYTKAVKTITEYIWSLYEPFTVDVAFAKKHFKADNELGYHEEAVGREITVLRPAHRRSYVKEKGPEGPQVDMLEAAVM